MASIYSFILVCLMVLSHDTAQSVISSSFFNNSISGKSKRDFLRVCYYSSGDPDPSEINGTLCTHIIKGFTCISNGILDPGTPEDLERYVETAKLKLVYPHLKTMISLGGGGNDAGFSEAMNSYRNRSRLIHSVMNFLITYNYDGLDIDWEFPVWNDNIPKDKPNFIMFLKEFRKISLSYYNRLFVLSVAVAGPKTIIDVAYDVPGMAKFVDFINLMSYDYHDYKIYTPFTGHNSPLYNRSVEHAYFATLNTAWSAFYWNKIGMPMEKIMVGLPTYAHTYKLLDPSLHDLDAPSTGFGEGNGSATYPEVCSFLKNGGIRKFDFESEVPYAYLNQNWYSYDDDVSIKIKTLWVKSNGFGGVMTFDLNCDDWKGECDGETKFPLHHIIYSILTSKQYS